MSWFNRPEGFIAKSFDRFAPSIEEANAIRSTAFVLVGRPMRPDFPQCDVHPMDPCREGFCGQCLDDHIAGILHDRDR